MSKTASPWIDASGEALNALRNVLAATRGLEFAVLVGSRANNSTRPDSDWDIDLQWHNVPPWIQTLGNQETLRRQIAEVLGMAPDRGDLIDRRCPTLPSPACGITSNLAALLPSRMATGFIRRVGGEGPWVSVNRPPAPVGLPSIANHSDVHPIASNPAPKEQFTRFFINRQTETNTQPAGRAAPSPCQRTTAFDSAHARNLTTPFPLRREGRGAGDIPPFTARARMPARPVSGDNT